MKVAISGGGIAGLSAAAVLAQRGHDVVLFERREGPATIGAGVVCFPNATRVLQAFGLEDAVRAVAGTPLCMRRLSRDGEPLGDLPLTVVNDQIGASSYSILRADLHAILTRFAQEAGARVEYGRPVVGVADAKALVFADGRSVEADWILGADGRMSSPLRKFVHGDDRPRYGGFVNWIGVARSREDAFDPNAIVDVWGTGERFGLVPISTRVAYFAGAAADAPGREAPTALASLLIERFAGWPEPVQAALRCADQRSLRQIDVYDHEPREVWHRERVLLIGDAAHAPLPTSGQGAGQALEDAFQLGALLDEGVPEDPARFFPRFTAIRRDKANAIVEAGRRFAALLFNPDPAFVAERNRGSQRTNFSEAARGMAQLWGRRLPA